MSHKPVALIIMDGYAISSNTDGNAIALAETNNIDKLINKYPNTTLSASGLDVGLPEKQMGNSEVGHLNIGAGRIVYQSLTRINKSIEDNTLFTNPSIVKAMNKVIENNGALHLFGLLSDGGVHSHIDHIIYLLQIAKHYNIEKVFLHGFLDGRDVPPKSAINYILKLQEQMTLIGTGKFATISGRYYAMDRDLNWNRTQKAYDAIAFGRGPKYSSPIQGVREAYDNDVVDEFIEPFIVDNDGIVTSNDVIIFANFRPDRAIQIATAFSNPKKADFETKNGPEIDDFYSMMHYSKNVKGSLIFEHLTLNNMLGDVIKDSNLKQLRIAETEKYAHVTFFLDGGIDKEIENAKRVLINSPKVATYDLKPEMSAYEVTEELLNEINENEYDLIILNYANCDMVGHTTNFEATVKAVEVVDECVGKVVSKISEIGGISLITSDHGNAEMMIDELGKPFSAHTTNKVPFIITEENFSLKSHGKLSDIAPTILDLLNVDKPDEMTGESLIIKKEDE